MKKILIAGGGVGGVVAAKRLSEKLKDKAEITMVSDNEKYEFPPFFANVALGDMTPEEVGLPLSRLQSRGIKFVRAKINKVDPENRKVLTDSGELPYDYLLASLGIEYDFDTYNLGSGYHNFTLDGAIKMRDGLSSFGSGRLVVFTPHPMYRCGIYPFEIVNQLDSAFRKRGIRDKVSITLVHPFKVPIEPLGSEAAKITEELFKQKGIEYFGGLKPVKVDSQRKTVQMEGQEIPYDFLITVPPIKVPSPFVGTSLTKATPMGEWTDIDPLTGRSKKYDDVFLPGEHSMPTLGLPTAGVPVHFTSLASSSVISGEILGEPVDPGQINAMVCAMDYGDLGLVINCDISQENGALKWIGNCYSVLTSPLGKYVKDMFYRSFLLTSM
ncbi:MAG: NAD(P)/FAD-dependent oxidoreductase [Thermoprotei archaeon]